jgi:hypothetical protein
MLNGKKMTRLNNLSKMMIYLLLLGYGLPVFGSVKSSGQDVEALWDSYLSNDAWKSPVKKFPFEHCFKSSAQRYGLPFSLLLAVARGESNFNPRAKSNRNCHGLMQILWPQTAKHLGIYRLDALYDPCTNIRAGARYLRELLDRYDGNLHMALAAYNYGPSRIPKNSGSNRIPEGARWYSGYIHHHLNHTLRGASATTGINAIRGRPRYNPGKRIEIITFNKPYRAAGFYRHLQSLAPGLNLDWYRMGLGRYQVVLLYTDARTLENGRRKLRKLGIRIRGR